jgi:uncharacterized sodium:solute symporter family permease YidK
MSGVLHGGVVKDCNFLGYDTMSLHTWFLMFLQNVGNQLPNYIASYPTQSWKIALCFCQNSVFLSYSWLMWLWIPQIDNERSDNSTRIITNLKFFLLMYNVVICIGLHCPSRYLNPFDVSEISSVSKNPNTQ